MSNKVKLNHQGFKTLLNSSEMVAAIHGEAQKIADRANALSKSGGYTTDVKHMPTRPVSSAYTGNMASVLDNAKHQTLTRALGGR